MCGTEVLMNGVTDTASLKTAPRAATLRRGIWTFKNVLFAGRLILIFTAGIVASAQLSSHLQQDFHDPQHATIAYLASVCGMLAVVCCIFAIRYANAGSTVRMLMTFLACACLLCLSFNMIYTLLPIN
jgi:hypothetical protein